MRSPLPPSLYAETAGPGMEAPPLHSDARASVAVVGGGFTGLSTALHLAERGTDVVLIESHEPGWGASGRNGGQVNPGLKHDPDEITHDFGADRAGRMIAFSGSAPELVFRLIERHQIVCEARQGGTLRAARSATAARAVAAAAAQYAKHGAPVTLLDRAGIAAATGTGLYACALLDRRGGSVNPLGYARGLARAARNAGARIHGGTPALGLSQAAGGWRIATPHGTVQAEQVVLATNGYTDALWPGLAQSIVPVRSMIAATEPLAPAIAATVLPGRSVLWEQAGVTVYYRVTEDNRLLMGGRSPSRELRGEHDGRTLVRLAETRWPALAGVRWTHLWNGTLAISADHYPHLHELASGLFACLAYNGRGVAMATAMGSEIAARLCGAAEADLAMPLAPLRPIPFHRFWRAGVAIRVARGQFADRLGL